MSSLSGRCLCGSVTVELSEAPAAIALCYCLHCRAAGGTAFSVNGLAPRSTISVAGELRAYECQADSGIRVTRRFCGGCGCPVETITDALNAAGLRIVKMGLFDPGTYAAPNMELYCDRRPHWLPSIAGAVTFPAMPPAP